MSEFKAGQRVRIEWADGLVLEGPVNETNGHPFVRVPSELDKFWLDREYFNPTITILSEPRPDEPTGIGAVVAAGHAIGGRGHWVRVESGWWINSRTNYSVSWRNLEEPVVLSEGWKP